MIDNNIKLSFESKAAWEEASKILYNEEGILLKGIAIILVGHISFDATYDEDGNELTPAGLHDDFAVDVVSPDLIPELDEYLIEPKTKYRHTINGNFNIITK